VKVNVRDGTCRACHGQLEIIDADDATMTVRCLECEEEYPVETDAFNDGGVVYWPAFMAQALKGPGP
jgi:hypothetical protein